MTVNDLIEVKPYNVKWITDQRKSSNLSIDNTFQRNYVWTNKHQVKLIETILMGYPFPEIYLWTKGTNSHTGETEYSIIDGQQRVGAIVDFVNNKFNLKKSYLDEENYASNFANRSFAELNAEERNRIWEYSLSVRFVRKTVNRDQIVKMFERLNSANMTLNPQELRNAKFEGEFIKVAEEIANSEFWEQYDLFTPNDVRRMQDIQFVSSILMFFRQGIGDDITQENYNYFYDKYNDEYPNRDEDLNKFHELNELLRIILDVDKSVSKFLRKKTHFYSLYLAIYSLKQKGIDITPEMGERYLRFVKVYNGEADMTHVFEEPYWDIISEYNSLAQSGTQKRVNRMKRFRLIEQIITGKIVKK